MSRYRGPRSKVIRRLGYLPAFSKKISNRSGFSLQRDSSKTKKFSQYNIRLKEKQKLRFYYGITERQLIGYLKKAKSKRGSSGIELLLILEMRLDNILYRMGIATTIFFARQLVVHGHILLNGISLTIPSFICRIGNIIGVKNTQRSRSLVTKNLYVSEDKFLPSHLSFSMYKFEGSVLAFASRSSLVLLINELLVVEYYSRKL
jgi:small subunit ribosomal protein S4